MVVCSMVEVEVKSQNATIVGSRGLCSCVATRGAASFPRTLDLARVSPHPTRAQEATKATRGGIRISRVFGFPLSGALTLPLLIRLRPSTTILELAALYTLPAYPICQSRKHRNHHNGLSTGTDARQQRRRARHQSRHPRRWPITRHSLPPSLPRPAKGIPHHPLTL